MGGAYGLRMPKEGYQPEGLRMPNYESMPEMGGGTGLQVPQDFSVDSGLTGGGADYTKGLTGTGAAMLGLQMMRQGQEQQQPMQIQNQIPQGRNMSYHDVMRMYGIKGLMG